jgi:hypothetical protein
MTSVATFFFAEYEFFVIVALILRCFHSVFGAQHFPESLVQVIRNEVLSQPGFPQLC